LKTTPSRTPRDSGRVGFRDAPQAPLFPYRATLAICSDLDETPDHRVYREIVRFLNPLDSTATSPGVGLEVGHTIFLMAPEGEFSYFGTDDTEKELVRALMRSDGLPEACVEAIPAALPVVHERGCRDESQLLALVASRSLAGRRCARGPFRSRGVLLDALHGYRQRVRLGAVGDAAALRRDVNA
jgi:hypothetical protein